MTRYTYAYTGHLRSETAIINHLYIRSGNHHHDRRLAQTVLTLPSLSFSELGGNHHSGDEGRLCVDLFPELSYVLTSARIFRCGTFRRGTVRR